MSFFILAGNAQATALTFGKAQSQVARVVGAQDDPSSVGAPEAVQQVMRRLAGEEWDFLQVRGEDISVVDHTGLAPGVEGYLGQYTVPHWRDLVTPPKLKAVGGADGDGDSLVYIHRMDWEKMASGGIGQHYYTLFPYGREQKLEILEHPTTPGTLEIRYFAEIRIPEDPDEALDIPIGPLESAVIGLAKAIVAADHGETRKASFHLGEGERNLGRARLADRRHLSGDHAWIPEWAARIREPKTKRFEGWGVMPDGSV